MKNKRGSQTVIITGLYKHFADIANNAPEGPLKHVYYKDGRMYATDAIRLVCYEWINPKDFLKDGQTYYVEADVEGQNVKTKINFAENLVVSPIELPNFDAWLYDERRMDNPPGNLFLSSYVLESVAVIFKRQNAHIKFIEDRGETFYIEGLVYKDRRPYANIRAVIAKERIDYESLPQKKVKKRAKSARR